MPDSEPLCASLCADSHRSRPAPKAWPGWASLERVKLKKCPSCAVLAEIVRVYSPRFEHGNGIVRGISLRSRSDTGTELPHGALAVLFEIYLKIGLSGHCVVITAIKGKENPWGLRVPSDSAGLDSMCFGGSTWSPQALALASTWVRDCLAGHQACTKAGATNDPLLPSRVISIGGGDPGAVTLCEPVDNTRARYMCLSYCWGGADFIQTTTANIQSHLLDGISLERLPAVFRDFIQVARAFQVMYVWIDSLCIIQDSTEDWQREAGRMAAVYQNSFLTVAAARAVNPHVRLFARREVSVVDCVQCHSVDHLLSREPSHSASFPLSSRGWAYQEQILSPRVLSFGPDEIFWHCQTTHNCECGQYRGIPQTFRDKTRASWGGRDGMDHLMMWHQAVEQYTKLSLTNWTDRLPAISGIADYHMAESRMGGATYLAGLWSDSLLYDLLWRQAPLGPRAPMTGTPRPWTAPSWSWASRDRPVLYDMPYLTAEHKVQTFCEVIAAECVLAGESKTGQIRSGYLKLRCPMMEVRRKKTVRGDSDRPTLEVAVKDVEGKGNKYATFGSPTFFDELGDNRSLPSSDLYLMRVVLCGTKNHLLILEKAGRPGSDAHTFTRIGLAWYTERPEMSLNWPDKLTEITMI
ncbi:heterokaryon incompatibility protein-domain-containing protein [Lasiosphaeria miniovina]|uniref:Heterokaryon incompatibility protein-domain-containing protein n=1 Tax=Lasiosphaeria miniovina TaxID=1954250 RepID=A0AA40A590_9PEZI|nr:heterokaryon incompatibility protein-domain-containing protein [Lasiosphaeria miniovina]KAK0709393.1 heterokaryon incompatibility protein-domain-containing protein [Lasiosphaeria miniovina]